MDSVGAKAEIGIDIVREIQHKAMFKPYEGTRRVVIIKEVEKLSIEAANCLLKTLEEPPSELLIILTSTSKDLLPPTLCSRCKEINMNPLSENEVTMALEAHKPGDAEIPALLSKICQGRVGWAIQAMQQPEILENRRETLDHVKNLSKHGIAHKIDYASELADRYSENRGSLIQTFRWIISFWRDIILIKCGAPEDVCNHDVKKMLIDQSKDYDMQELISAIKSTTHTMELLNANANPRLVIEHLFLTLKNNTMASLK
jgi:DNA polymerase-3 subunit delta'